MALKLLAAMRRFTSVLKDGEQTAGSITLEVVDKAQWNTGNSAATLKGERRYRLK